MHHRRDNLILFASTSALAVLLCKSKDIPLIKVPFPFIFIQLVKCDQYSQKKKKKKFQATLVTNTHPKGEHFDLLSGFRLLFFFIFFFFLRRSPSPLADCNTFRELYKTKLSALSQQQTHLCSCCSIKERRPILCRFLWLASQRHRSVCKLSGRNSPL